MTCPNQATTITIPYPTGAATEVPVDSATCNPIDPTQCKVQLGTSAGITLGATTVPALTEDSAGLHYSANGAAFGSRYVLFHTYLPNGLTWSTTATVGGPVTPVSTTVTP
jgi:hypothetical protein